MLAQTPPTTPNTPARANAETRIDPLEQALEAGELVLELALDGFVLSDSLLAYQHRGQVLLPLGELARQLALAIRVNPAEGTASGFVLTPDRGFALDIHSLQVRANGTDTRIEAGQAMRIGEDIYVSLALLSRWLPIDLVLQRSVMRLGVQPREQLPLQARLERERLGAQLRQAPGQAEDPDHPLQRLPYRWLSPPVINQSLGVQLRAGPGATQTESAHTAYLTADVLGMEGAAYVRSASGQRRPDWRWTLGRHDPDPVLLGPLRARSVELGSISMPWLRNLGVPTGQGVGVAVSNRRSNQPTRFDSETLQGDLPPGWDVTLYYNEALVGFQVARPDGRYVFDAMPLSFGRNEFTLVFAGPLGQTRTERRNHQLDQSPLAAGERRYALGHWQADGGRSSSVGELELGLTRTLTLNAGIARQPLASTGEGMAFGVLGLRRYWGGAILGSEITLAQSGGWLGEFALKTGYRRYSLDLMHTQAQGRYASDLFPVLGLRRRSVWRLQGTLAPPLLPRLPFSVALQREVLGTSVVHDRFTTRVSMQLGAAAFTHGLNWQRIGSAVTASGLLQMDRRFMNTSLSAQLAYAWRPQARVQTLMFTGSRQLGDNFSVNAGLVHALSPTRTQVVAGLNKPFDVFILTLSGSYSSDKALAVGLLLSMSISREPHTGRWHVDALPMAGSGTVAALVFVDRNLNGVHDADEETVPNAGFIINRGGRSATRTNNAGQALIGQLAVRQHVDLTLDTATLEDPLWQSVHPGWRVLPRPGRIQPLAFPVVSTSEIDGTVTLLKNGLARGIGDARVELVNGSGEVVRSTQSTSDGFYLMTQVLPGRFTLRISPAQLNQLELADVATKNMTVPADGDFIHGQDFELRGKQQAR